MSDYNYIIMYFDHGDDICCSADDDVLPSAQAAHEYLVDHGFHLIEANLPECAYSRTYINTAGTEAEVSRCDPVDFPVDAAFA